MIARGKRQRSSATRTSRASASGSRPSITVTDVATVAMAPLGADEPQLAQARRLLDVDRVVVGEAGVAEAVLRRLAAHAVDRFVEPGQRQVSQRVGADELPDLLGGAAGGDQL